MGCCLILAGIAVLVVLAPLAYSNPHPYAFSRGSRGGISIRSGNPYHISDTGMMMGLGKRSNMDAYRISDTGMMMGLGKRSNMDAYRISDTGMMMGLGKRSNMDAYRISDTGMMMGLGKRSNMDAYRISDTGMMMGLGKRAEPEFPDGVLYPSLVHTSLPVRRDQVTGRHPSEYWTAYKPDNLMDNMDLNYLQ